MRRTLALTLALALPIGISACDDDGTSPDDDLTSGSFEATVSGGLTGEFSGDAFFGETTDPTTGNTFWVMILSSGSETSGRTIYFGRVGASRPGTGTLDLVDLSTDQPGSGGLFAWFFDFTGQASTGFFNSTGGSMTVNQSSGDAMTGTFTIEASGTAIQAGQPVEIDVEITGSFNASSGQVGLPSVF
jgi:hypothetical protein